MVVVISGLGGWYILQQQSANMHSDHGASWVAPPLTRSTTDTSELGTFKASSLEPEMIAIPHGCFRMGSPISESERRDNERLHQVCVNNFKLARYEVTNREFRQFRPAHDSKSFSGHTLNSDDQPVVDVSWSDAQAYVQWLSNQTGHPYRLPTEAEWEYAARAGTTTSRFWGDDHKNTCIYANVHDQASGQLNAFDWDSHDCDDGRAVTVKVGSYKANPWGLHDMLGNAKEWTCSAYTSDYDGNESRCADPTQTKAIVIRGGSWSSGPNDVRAAFRNDWPPSDSADVLGFRLVQD